MRTAVAGIVIANVVGAALVLAGVSVGDAISLSVIVLAVIVAVSRSPR